MTAAAAEAWEESPAKWQRRDPAWSGAEHPCPVPGAHPSQGQGQGPQEATWGAVIPKDQAYQGQANTLRPHRRQGHKTQNSGFSSSDLTCYVTSKSQPHPSSRLHMKGLQTPSWQEPLDSCLPFEGELTTHFPISLSPLDSKTTVHGDRSRQRSRSSIGLQWSGLWLGPLHSLSCSLDPMNELPRGLRDFPILHSSSKPSLQLSIKASEVGSGFHRQLQPLPEDLEPRALPIPAQPQQGTSLFRSSSGLQAFLVRTVTHQGRKLDSAQGPHPSWGTTTKVLHTPPPDTHPLSCSPKTRSIITACAWQNVSLPAPSALPRPIHFLNVVIEKRIRY